VLSKIWNERLFSLPKETKKIIVNPKDISYVIGYRNCNREALNQAGRNISFIQSEQQKQDTFSIAD
jgi:hypothetical protein